MSTALCIAGFLCLLAACHPFITYPWSLIVLQVLRPARPSTGGTHDVRSNCAICVCAYNEERSIARKVENLLALREREPGLEILIYVDGATDRTAGILREYESKIDLHIGTRRLGKTYGMNLLASKAKAQILIFTDANVLMDMDCVRDLLRYFADPEIGCVCGSLLYTNGAASTTASSGSAYWRFEETIKKLEMEAAQPSEPMDRYSRSGALCTSRRPTTSSTIFSVRVVEDSLRRFPGRTGHRRAGV